MDKIEEVKVIDCPAYRFIGGNHFCGLGKIGDQLCWVAYKHPCQLFPKFPDNPDGSLPKGTDEVKDEQRVQT